jgi:hypothetical protein
LLHHEAKAAGKKEREENVKKVYKKRDWSKKE